MIDIDILNDEQLQDNVKIFISGLLPHENYDREFFSSIFTKLTDFIHVRELSGEYYVLLSVLEKIRDVAFTVNSNPLLNSTILQATLNTNISDLIFNKYVEIEQVLRLENQTLNLDIAKDRPVATALLYRRVMDLFNDCMDMKIKSDEVINYTPALLESLKAHVTEQVIQRSALIMQEGIKWRGNRIYGPDAAIRNMKRVTLELTDRLENSEDKVVVVDSMSKSKSLAVEADRGRKVLAKYGIPNLDDYTPMLAHRLVVVQANENVGKTIFAIDCASNLLLAGRKVLYMCGETSKGSIKSRIISNYVYKKFGKYVPDTVITQIELEPELVKDKDIVRKVRCAIDEIINSGNLMLKSKFSYESLFEELKSAWTLNHFDAIFIDHSNILTGGTSLYENISSLAKQMLNFSEEFPVYCQVLSHMSGTGKSSLAKDSAIQTSGTKGSGDLSANAYEVFTLKKTPLLDKQKLRKLEVSKRRGPAIPDDIVLKFLPVVSSFKWDSSIQNSDITKKVSPEEAKRKLQETYGAVVADDSHDNGEVYSL